MSAADAIEFHRAMDALEPYVSRSPDNGTFSINAPPSATESISPRMRDVLVERMEFANSLILSGELISTADLRVVPPEPPNPAPESHGTTDLGCNYAVYCTLRLSNGWTNYFVNQLQGGATTSALGSAIASIAGGPIVAAMAIAAAMQALGAWFLDNCNSGHGVWITNIPPDCGSQ